MRKLSILFALLLLTLASVNISSAWTPVSTSLDLHATVLSVCKVESNPWPNGAAMSTPSVDPSISTSVTVSRYFGLRCTNGTPFDVLVDNGLYFDGNTRRVKHQVQDAYIPYSLTWGTYYYTSLALNNSPGPVPAPQVGLGFVGFDKWLAILFTVTFNPEDYKNAWEGFHSDLVTVTVIPR